MKISQTISTILLLVLIVSCSSNEKKEAKSKNDNLIIKNIVESESIIIEIYVEDSLAIIEKEDYLQLDSLLNYEYNIARKKMSKEDRLKLKTYQLSWIKVRDKSSDKNKFVLSRLNELVDFNKSVYDKESNLYFSGKYIDGKKEGEWKVFTKYASLKKKIIYKNDNIIKQCNYEYYNSLKLKSKGFGDCYLPIGKMGSFRDSYLIVYKENGEVDFETWYNWVNYRKLWLTKTYKNNIPVFINTESSDYYDAYGEREKYYPIVDKNDEWVAYNSDSIVTKRYHFKNGLQNGRCVRFEREKILFDGIYKEGIAIEAKEIRYYEGKDSIKDIIIYKNGKVFSGKHEYTSGRSDAKIIEILKEGLVVEKIWFTESGKEIARGIYKDGKEYSGKFGHWDHYGNVFSFEHYKAGKLHGSFKKYYRYNIRQKGQYKNGNKVGMWVSYYDDADENGEPKIKEVKVYKEDIIHFNEELGYIEIIIPKPFKHLKEILIDEGWSAFVPNINKNYNLESSNYFSEMHDIVGSIIIDKNNPTEYFLSYGLFSETNLNQESFSLFNLYTIEDGKPSYISKFKCDIIVIPGNGSIYTYLHRDGLQNKSRKYKLDKSIIKEVNQPVIQDNYNGLNINTKTKQPIEIFSKKDLFESVEFIPKDSSVEIILEEFYNGDRYYLIKTSFELVGWWKIEGDLNDVFELVSNIN